MSKCSTGLINKFCYMYGGLMGVPHKTAAVRIRTRFSRQVLLTLRANRQLYQDNKKATLLGGSLSVGIDLFSRAASSQVSSARMSLTTVFGMGTGGPSPSLTPTMPCSSHCCVIQLGYIITPKRVCQHFFEIFLVFSEIFSLCCQISFATCLKTSPRPS